MEEGDLQSIQTALIVDIEHEGKNIQYLRNMVKWIKVNKPEAIEPYEEKSFAKEINSDKATWDESYYAKQSVYLETNFSEKRLNHLIDVREYLNSKK